MSNIVYKVLQLEKGKLYSAYVIGDAKKQYKLNIRNKPSLWLSKKGYKLLAFDNIECAEVFRKSLSWASPMNQYAIFKAEATGIQTKHLPGRYDWEYISKNTEWRSYMFTNEWPKGSIMCNSIKLIEEVK
jgi:hypothetical protein